MTDNGQTHGSGGLSRTWWLFVSLGSVAAATVLLVQKVETYDSYCGSVLYDTQMSSPCGDEMRWRRLVVVVLMIVAIGTLFVAVSPGHDRRERSLAWMVALGFGLTTLGSLLAANRLLQPAGEWCGSLVNRHRTYEPMREARCTDRLRPHLVFGMLWIWVALCGLAAAMWAALGLRSRQD